MHSNCRLFLASKEAHTSKMEKKIIEIVYYALFTFANSIRERM